MRWLKRDEVIQIMANTGNGFSGCDSFDRKRKQLAEYLLSTSAAILLVQFVEYHSSFRSPYNGPSLSATLQEPAHTKQ